MIFNKVSLRFIGEDGSMGLRKGKTYLVRICTKLGRIVVIWGKNGEHACPYSSLKALCENWEDAR